MYLAAKWMKKVTPWFNTALNPNPFSTITLKLVLALLFSFVLQINTVTFAEDSIPDGIRDWLNTQDNEAVLADDGLIKLSNGDEYLLVVPAEKKTVTKIDVESVTKSDDKPAIVLFNNGYYLLRVLTLDGGQKSLPLLEDVPSDLKAGRFLSTLNLSESLYIPTQWKTLVVESIEDSTTTPEQLEQSLTWLNLTQSKLVSSKDKTAALPCQPAKYQGLLVVAENQSILACQDQPLLFELSQDAKQNWLVTQKVYLKAPTSSVAYNAANKMVYLSHPSLVTKTVENTPKRSLGGWFKLKKSNAVAEKPTTQDYSELSQYNLELHKLISPIATNQKVDWVSYSNFRKQLYALSNNHQNLLIINTLEPTKQQSIKLEVPVKDWSIQNEKTLWLLTEATEKTPQKIIAIDLRWQEIYDTKTLTEKASSLSSNEQWLFVFYPQSKTVERLNLLSLGTKETTNSKQLVLSKACADSQLQLSPHEKMLYLNSETCSKSIVVELGGFREKETIQHTLAGQHQAAWLVPYTPPSSKLARVKFQDARLMLQNGKAPQTVKWPSVPHDQTTAQDPQAPSSQPLTP